MATNQGSETNLSTTGTQLIAVRKMWQLGLNREILQLSWAHEPHHSYPMDIHRPFSN